MEFDRSKYYSQTDVIKKYNICIKKYKAILEEKGIPVVRRKIQMEGYTLLTLYVLREDIKRVGLGLR